ncbi:MAG: UDP-N-acetylmuramoyl-tripeptide--D-alanyl-D-alanine ligase [Trueperella sp.]|nr:UDP-N-acetylmuramoyl-tripeptide--D-alanyl-D-alanine ligase [Trueperella sp.]
MIPIPLADIARAAAALAPDGTPITSAVPVTGVVTDNRQVERGNIFVAIAGERVNGNKFAADALNRGAAAVLSSEPLQAQIPADRLLVVPEPVAAVGKIARYVLAEVRKVAQPDVVAITGSVGKTTTKDLLATLLAGRGPIIAPPGSFNNELGLPLTVLRTDAATRTLVLEMGADHIGNLDYLTAIAPPNISVVLAVARAHLGEFGGIENVARAKQELVTNTPADGTVVLNLDDPRVAAMASAAQAQVRYFSATGNPDAAIRATEVAVDAAARASFILHTPHGVAPVQLQLVGEHHVSNALAAAAVADILGIDIAEIAEKLSASGPASAHRMDVKALGECTVVDDSYNANPDSMRAALAATAKLAAGHRQIAVLGSMLELGADTLAEHEALGRYVAQSGISVLIGVGEQMQAATAIAETSGVEVHNCETAPDATALLTSILHPGDVILLKGSHGSGVWQIADALAKES